MKHIVCLFTIICLASSCGVSTLYYWGGTQNGATAYENLAYKDYKTQTPEAMCKLICVYQDMVSNPKGIRNMPPPGICAEYGYLLLQPDTANIFAEYATSSQRTYFDSSDFTEIFPELGKELLQKEITYYPESSRFITPLIEKLTQ